MSQSIHKVEEGAGADIQATVAILIKTYLREGAVNSLVQTIEKYCDVPYKLYIADEFPLSKAKKSLYKELEQQGHKVVIFDESKPVSVCLARNRLVGFVDKEEYILRLDDDFHFHPGTSIANMLNILEHCPEIGALSDIEIQGVDGKGIKAGEVSSQQGFFFYNDINKVLYKQPVPLSLWIWQKVGMLRYAHADFTRNFLLIRKAVFEDVSWNESLQIHGEHTEFMLRLKKTGWQLAFTPDSSHIHNEPEKKLVDKNYAANRNSQMSEQAMHSVYEKEWSIKDIRTIVATKQLVQELELGYFKRFLVFLLKKTLNFLFKN
jgi:GT2 family glycosyltransferase